MLNEKFKILPFPRFHTLCLLEDLRPLEVEGVLLRRLALHLVALGEHVVGEEVVLGEVEGEGEAHRVLGVVHGHVLQLGQGGLVVVLDHVLEEGKESRRGGGSLGCNVDTMSKESLIGGKKECEDII